mmetsp:Transcript_12229/g.23201  ORF Transcript_12229/g.23201 Transcript_12229/m.23201 type:complete len:621 (-) Transcript_12229:165-2027(-)
MSSVHQVNWDNLLSKSRNLLSLAIMPESVPESVELFLAEFEAEASKFRCTSTQKLMKKPCKVNGRYYEGAVIRGTNVSYRFQYKIRRFAIRTLNTLHVLSTSHVMTDETLEIFAQCFLVLKDRYIIFKGRALASLNARQAEYLMQIYVEAQGASSLLSLINYCLKNLALRNFSTLLKVFLMNASARWDTWHWFNTLLEFSNMYESTQDLGSVLHLCDQFQLEAILRAFKRLSDRKLMENYIELSAKELLLKRTFLKQLKRFESSLLSQSNSSSDKQAEFMPTELSQSRWNLATTESYFSQTIGNIRAQSSKREALAWCSNIEAHFWGLRQELEDALEVSEDAFLDLVEAKLQQAKILERQANPSSESDSTKPEKYFYWLTSAMSLKRVRLEDMAQIHIRNSATAFSMKLHWCDCAEKLLAICLDNDFEVIDLQRDCSTYLLARLNKPRFFHGMGYDAGFVYVVAGRTLAGKVFESERYSIKENKWELFDSIPVSYKRPNTIAHNRSLFVLGGPQVARLYLIQELCLVSLTWSLLGVKLNFAGYYYSPSFFKLPGCTDKLYLLAYEGIWEFSPEKLHSKCKVYRATYTSSNVTSKATLKHCVGLDIGKNLTVQNLALVISD